MKATIKIEFDPNSSEFPEPIMDDWVGIDNDMDCLHNAAIYEKWTEKARACGRNDLVILYETASAYWRTNI